jgi:iron complex transport system substrate-binding protein
VRHQQLFEVKSPDILQPGPAALTDGVAKMHQIILRWMDADAGVAEPAA